MGSTAFKKLRFVVASQVPMLAMARQMTIFLILAIPIQCRGYVITGQEWPDSNGDGIVEVTFSYSNLFGNSPNPHNGTPAGAPLGGNLSDETMRQSILEALNLWASVAPLDFTEVNDTGPDIDQNRNTNLDSDSDTTEEPHVDYSADSHALLRFGHHPMDGTPSVDNTLAHGFFPSSGGLGGDVHFDTADTWTVDLFLETALHEIGHALGLEHEVDTDGPGPDVQDIAIMNRLVGGRFSDLGSSFLFQDDIQGIRSIYGSGTGSVTSLGNENSRVWARPDDGSWNESESWSGHIPDGSTSAVFNRGGGYGVSFNSDGLSKELHVERSVVTFELNGHTLSANGDIVADKDGVIIVDDGRLRTEQDVRIGSTLREGTETKFREGTIAVDNGGLLELEGTLFIESSASRLKLDGGVLRARAMQDGSGWIELDAGGGGGTIDADTLVGVPYRIGGTGQLTMTGNGALRLSNHANDYGGATLILGRKLEVGEHEVIPDSSPVTVTSGAQFDTNNFSETIGSLSGSGEVTIGLGSKLKAGFNHSSTTFSGVINGLHFRKKRR